MSMPQRPDCFEFALEFIGEPEAPLLRGYIETIEAELAILQIAMADEADHRKEAERACRTLQRFANMAIDAAFQGCDWHGADIQDTAHQMGLLKHEPYDPDIHGSEMEGEVEPGEAIYVKTGPLNLVTQL